MDSDSKYSHDFRRGRNRLAATVVLGHWIKHTYTSGLWIPIWPEIRTGLGLRYWELGTFSSASKATFWIATMVAGYFADRFPGKASWFLALSLGIIGISFVMAGFAPNYWVMLGVMLIFGAGPALYHPPAIGELSRRFPERRGVAISLHGMGGIAGEIIGPILVAFLLEEFLDWRDVLKIGFFPAAVAAFLIWASIRSVPQLESQSKSDKAYLASIGMLLTNRVLLLLITVVAILSMGHSAIDHFIAVYLTDHAGYSLRKIAVIVALSQAVGFGAQPIMGYLSDRFGYQAVLVPGLIVGTSMTFVLGVVDPGAVLIFAVIARGMFKFSLHHIFVAAAIDTARGQVQSTIVSLVYGSGILGIISPTISGLIADRYGIQSGFFYAGSLSMLALLILVTLKLPQTATQAEK